MKEWITINILGTKIEWDGPGTYVAQSVKGAITYYKLPEGKTPLKGTIVRDFLNKPEPYVKVENNGLWE